MKNKWNIEFSRGSMGGNQQLKYGDKYIAIVYECNVLDEIVDFLNANGFDPEEAEQHERESKDTSK